MKAPYAPILTDFESMRAAARMCAIREAFFEGLGIGTPAKVDPRISWRKDRVPVITHEHPVFTRQMKQPTRSDSFRSEGVGGKLEKVFRQQRVHWLIHSWWYVLLREM
jgi:hypothetical protein